VSYEIVDPEELGAPRGWSHGLLGPVGGRALFVAGQIGSDGAGRVVSADFVGQFERALENVLRVVTSAGGRAESVGRLTIFVTEMETYRSSLPALGVAYRRQMGRHYPAMSLVEVKSLVDPAAKVEIEATAIL
jgi:enamine deaminase RidA (YjgF/YER057c/UK114 family)